MKFISKRLSLLLWGVHYDGIPFTCWRILVKLSALFGTRGTRSEWFQRLSERQFDKRFHVETSGLVQPETMKIPDNLIEHTIEYAPTSANRFGWLLSQLPVCLEEFIFIDIGSGKGRAILMASEFPFEEVIGIELGTSLHEVALKNIARFQSRKRVCQAVSSINQNATEYDFPEEPLIIYLFNPFSAEILQQVLNNIETSLKACPRPVIVLYYNPLHAELFQQAQLFQSAQFDFDPGPGWELYSAATKPER